MYVNYNYQCSQQWIYYKLISFQICISIANSCPFFTFTLWISSHFRMNKWNSSIHFRSDSDLRNPPPSNTKNQKNENNKFKLNNNLCITLNLSYPECCFSVTKQQTLDIQSTFLFFCVVCCVGDLTEIAPRKSTNFVSYRENNESE